MAAEIAKRFKDKEELLQGVKDGDPDALFIVLTQKMAEKGMEAQQRVHAHLRAATGHSTLPNYNNNGASRDDKAALYRLLLDAVLRGDYSKLDGKLPQGQATLEPETIQERPQADSQDDKPDEQLTARRPEPAAGPEGAPRITLDAGRMSPVAKAILEEISPFLPERNTPPPPVPEVDPEEVKRIAKEICDEKLGDERIGKLVDQAMSGYTRRLEVVSNGAVNTIDGLVHWQFPQVLAWLEANVPLWLWGEAGGGKTSMGYQLAKALNLEPYVISIDPTMTVGKLMGFKNMATGEFQEGFAYRPFKEGGLMMWDEIDIGDQGIIASANALLSNDFYRFPNGELVPKHPNFRFIAGANTKGNGATAGYTARNRLDAATLDRFAIIKLEYDTALECAVSLGKPKISGKAWEKASTTLERREEQCERWVGYVQRARETVAGTVLVSPRASILGCRAIRAGIPVNEVADALLFKLTTDDTKLNIIRACGGEVS